MMNPLINLIDLDENQKRNLGIEFTPQEIFQQVDLWNSTGEKVLSHLDELTDIFNLFLDKKNSIIYLTGAGTSEFVGYCLQSIFRQNFHIPVQVVSNGKIVTHPHDYFGDLNPLMISFARSGDSPESIGAYEIANMYSHAVRHIIITCNKNGNLAKRAQKNINSLLIGLDEKTNDQGLAMTASFSNMVIAGQICAHVQNTSQYKNDLSQMIDAGKNILTIAPSIAKKVAETDFQRAVFLGSGSNFGTAIESHLKLQELTDGQIICGYNTYLDLRHGPKAVINKKTLIVAYLSSDPYVRKYEIELLNEVRQKELGKFTVIIGESIDGEIRTLSDEVIDISRSSHPMIPDTLTPPVYVIFGQLLGLFKSLQLGLKPDSPSLTGVIHRVVQGVRIYDPKIFELKGVFQEIKG